MVEGFFHLMRTALQLGFALLPFLISGFVTQGPKPKTDTPKVNFNRDVKPILSNHCFKCHGPDAAQAAAGLRLDQFELATADRDGQFAVKPGSSSLSRIVIRASEKEEGMKMPPPDSGVKPLTSEQIAILRAWIDQGAKYEKHWSFVAPKMPAKPIVSNPKWVKNNIDAYILAKLDESGLTPNPEAEKVTLISRASLTLTGLPPTPEEIKAFTEDKSSKAYEKVIDRLLNSKQYGQHQARYWLDAVRYGDTHGLHLDNERGIYPYRDWVVRAFNKDLRIDKFTEWQLAGDMLPSPTTEQLIATGYIRMNPTTSEGGAIEEEFLAKNTFDRVDTTSTIFLGLTVACSRCHDHKYDPISQKDYFRMFAYFNSTEDSPLDGNALLPPPVIKAATEDQERELKKLKEIEAQFVIKTPVSEADKWIQTTAVSPVANSGWEVSPPYTAKNFDEAFDTAYPAEPGVDKETGWKAYPLKIGVDASNFINKEKAAGYIRGVLSVDKDTETTLSLSSDDGLKVWLNGDLVHSIKVPRGVTTAIDRVKVKLKAGDNRIVFKVANGDGGDGLILRIGDEKTERISKVSQLWSDPKQDRKASAKTLVETYLELGPETDRSKGFRTALKNRTEFENALPSTLIAKELAMPRPAHVLKRGEYNLKEDKVDREIPEVFGKLPKDLPQNRLGFAKWLTAKDHPLFARVFVNRIWQQHFGNGIVKTSEDFGSQGEWPVNPELLDFLAVQFANDGFSLKRLHKLILMSSTFRQKSTVDAVKLAKDPENRLLSRAPRFRLDAEVIRDRALAASGLLLDSDGGKGFKPYQPEGIWEAIAFLDSNTSKYVRDKDLSIYRRSLYLFWKRTSPHPVMLAFDAPMREMCTVRRSVTNTPLQALVTLNEPAFVEAARVLAERVWTSSTEDSKRLDAAYQYALGRSPSAKEVDIMSKALIRYKDRFISDKSGAESLLKVGDAPLSGKVPPQEHAAWMLLCSTLMNTDEFLTLP